jgi:HAD superfamily hydrolase (TIGR01509 family)
MIKSIFFDFDGVLTTDGKGSGTTCKNLQKDIPDVPYEKILQCYRVHHPDVLIGKTSHSEIWDEFCTCVGTPVDISLLYTAFKDTPKNVQMFDLVEKLRKNYKVGIITDNGKERLDILAEDMNLHDAFDSIIVSANVGSTKHEADIFQKALDSVGSDADECVFIDNDQKNLIVPAKLGFHTFWHDHEKNDLQPLMTQLESWGVMLLLDKIPVSGSRLRSSSQRCYTEHL